VDPFSGSGNHTATALQNSLMHWIRSKPFMNFVGATKSLAKRKKKEEYIKEFNGL
jgi:hypothetical protein